MNQENEDENKEDIHKENISKEKNVEREQTKTEENKNRIEEIIKPKQSTTIENTPFYKNKTLIILTSILTPIILLTIIIACFIIFNKTTFDMQQYILIETQGYDTYATIDLNQYLDYSNEIGEKYNNSRSLYKRFLNSIEPKVDKEKDLKNGDIVTISVKYDEEIAKKLKLNPKNIEFKYQIKDLQEPRKISLFSDINIEFSGYSPIIKAKVVNNSENDFLKTVTYSLDKTQNLKEGDEVVVKAKYNIERARQLGYILEGEETKNYKVENVGIYITSKNQLTQELKAELDQKLTEKFDATFNAPLSEDLARNYHSTSCYLYKKLFNIFSQVQENIQFTANHEKTYILTPTDLEKTIGNFNKYYRVYKVKFTPSEESVYREENGYIIIEANTIAIEPEGKYTYKIEDFYFRTYDKLDDILKNATNSKYNIEEI